MELAQLLPPQALDCDPVLEFEAGIERAAHELDLDPWILQRIKHPEREITVHIPVTRDDGTAMTISGYRIQHSHARGPSIGPVTISPTCHPNELRLTAAVITLQSALLGLRLGGAAGGIVCDPSRVGEHEMRHIVGDFLGALRESTGALKDVLAPEGPGWLIRCVRHADQAARGHYEPAAIVGDSLLNEAFGSAIVALVRDALDCADLSRLRVAIQGFGRNGRTIAEAFHREHARIVGVADRSGAVIRRDGLDFTALTAYADDGGVVFGYPNAEAATNADLLESDCDILVLTAAAQQVGAHNAPHIRARAILELAQNAVTAPVESLADGCMLIPYLIAACPQLALWAYEWQRGISGSDIDCREAAEAAATRVVGGFDVVRALARNRRVSLSQAALLTAVARLEEAFRS